jgi:hypothetical protein
MIRILRRPALLVCLLGGIGISAGCSLKTMAVKTVANTLAAGGDTFTRDDDPELVRDAVPFALADRDRLRSWRQLRAVPLVVEPRSSTSCSSSKKLGA